MSETKYDAILVGGSGFIGTAFAQALSQRGERVLSISREKSGSVLQSVTEEVLDVSDREVLESRFPEGDTVFIFIGQNGANFDVKSELQNLNNLVSVLNMRLPKKVFYLSSALAYGEREMPAEEDSSLHPIDPYSQFKKEAEELLEKELDPRIALGILRLANVYGNPMNRGFVGFVLKNIVSGSKEKITINGNGLQERDYIFIDDVISALLAVKEGFEGRDTINIATGKSYSLLDLVEKIFEVAGRTLPYEVSGKETVEVNRSVISNTKLRKKYGFTPVYSLDLGLEQALKRYSTKEEGVKDRKMLFLGGEGFIGRNLCEYFSKKNKCFSVGVHESCFPNRRADLIQKNPYTEKIPGEYDYCIHLIDNKVALDTFLEKEKSLVQNLPLEHCKHFIIFSSAVMYANPESEYGLRKRLLEDFYTEYCNERNIPLTIVRPFNAFGPFQIPYRQGSLVANLIYNFQNDKPTEINDMDAKRDFLYSEDIARFVECVLAKKKEGVLDIGTGKLTSVRELIDHLERSAFRKKPLIIDKKNKENIEYRAAHQDVLETGSMIDLDTGIEKINQFFKEHQDIVRVCIEKNLG